MIIRMFIISFFVGSIMISLLRFTCSLLFYNNGFMIYGCISKVLKLIILNHIVKQLTTLPVI